MATFDEGVHKEKEAKSRQRKGFLSMYKRLILLVIISLCVTMACGSGVWAGVLSIDPNGEYTNNSYTDKDLPDLPEGYWESETTIEYAQTDSGREYMLLQSSSGSENNEMARKGDSDAVCLMLLPEEEDMDNFLEETELLQTAALEELPVVCVRSDWQDQEGSDKYLLEIRQDLKEMGLLNNASIFLIGFEKGADYAAREALLHTEWYTGLVAIGGEGVSEEVLEEYSADPDTDHALSVWIIAQRKTKLLKENIDFWKEWNGITTSNQTSYQCAFADELYLPRTSTAGNIENSNNRMGAVLFSRCSEYRGASICSDIFRYFVTGVRTNEINFRDSFTGFEVIRIDDPNFSYHRVQMEGQQRDYWTYVPDSAMTGDDPPSLILCLHGNGGSGEDMVFLSMWHNIAVENNCVVLYPSSLYKNGSQHYWQNIKEEIVFLRWLVIETCQRFHIDRTHVYVTGFSNGAGMAQNLAVRCSDLFAAAALSAPAYFDEEYYDGPIFDVNAVAILFSYGTEDDYLKEYQMSADIDGAPAISHLEYWRGLYGFQQNFYQKEIKGKFTVYTYRSVNQLPVCQWIVVEGKDHDYPEEEVSIYYDFMKQFSKAENGTLYYNGQQVDIMSGRK